MNNILSLGKDCCGCTACEQVCLVQCIEFKPDKEGFMYPVINEDLCIGCGKCVKHCPVMNETTRHNEPVMYGAKLKKPELAKESSSGGVFVIMAQNILKKGGVVFGCAYDENLVARHIAIESEDELYKLKNSKYVQSDMTGIYAQVKKALDDDRYVLFTGTGCQSAGLCSYLGGKEYPKLINVDVVCHGVPSPALFKNYIEWKGKKMGGKLNSYVFRSKEKAGWSIYYKAENEHKSESKYAMFDPYFGAFLACRIQRESCYNCHFARIDRHSDFTLADFWGVEISNPEFYDTRGVSLVLISSEKGRALWNNELLPLLDTIETNVKDSAKLNGNLIKSPQRPADRDTVYDGFDTNPDEYFSKKMKPPLLLGKRLKMLVPVSVKGRIKHMLGR